MNADHHVGAVREPPDELMVEYRLEEDDMMDRFLDTLNAAAKEGWRVVGFSTQVIVEKSFQNVSPRMTGRDPFDFAQGKLARPLPGRCEGA